ncbi:FKBP-type peptidyl-prolyl cis-trans isomerase N-terminal domain-containing protein [Anatilimnocola floriformis]|uniref:FKBP-type peptidyl-prolyl cis-trans isomerase N-terminal domain-containing protein n=1 Tax=Anatilimnocola floriformis TaxID=2948575 RepID=UPI0020C4B0E9|nr:FKBP-type peptidyl-prolyl cis-trans isomerase [Anatilimnocola floriformis]
MCKRFLLAAFLPMLCVSFAGAQVTPPAVRPPAPAGNAPAAAPPAAGLGTLEQQASYAIGLDFAKRLKSDDAPIDLDAICRGIRAGLSGTKPELTDEQMSAVMQKFITALQAKRAEADKRAMEVAKKEGAAFLAENAKKPGVKQTASGLQYKVLKAGTGATPKATDVVKVHYTGKLLNGETFDSSLKRGLPSEFPANRVIPGWVEALQLMKVGDKWELYIPSDLAYGDDGNERIPPASLLKFEVELLDIVK